MMNTLAPGTQILYTREDSGGSIQNDGETVLLRPCKPLTVSTAPDGDVTPALATRLVEDQVCRVYSLPPAEAKTEAEAKPAAKEEPEAEAEHPQEDDKSDPEAKPEQESEAKPEGVLLG